MYGDVGVDVRGHEFCGHGGHVSLLHALDSLLRLSACGVRTGHIRESWVQKRVGDGEFGRKSSPQTLHEQKYLEVSEVS